MMSLLLSARVCFAADEPEVPQPSTLPAPKAGTAVPQTSRKTSLDFEGGVVEGLNRGVRDSLTQVGEVDPKKGRHLYQKRMNFDEELKEVYRDLEYSR
jgi:hypothetical protein